MELLHCQLILNLVKNKQQMREHLVNKFAQDVEKPAEIKQETPYEKRIREENEQHDKDYKPPEIIHKTPQEIQAEKLEIEKDYRDKFEQAYKEELSINEKTLSKLFGGNSQKSMENLGMKVVLISNHLKMSTTKYENSKIKNEVLQAFVKQSFNWEANFGFKSWLDKITILQA